MDLSKLEVKNVTDSYGGAAWCISISPRGKHIAVGCEDGAARIFNYDDNKIEYLKAYQTTGSRILSIAFHPQSSKLFIGCADGTIRCIDEVRYFHSLCLLT